MNPLEELKLKRFQYLKALYEATGGSSSAYIQTPYVLGETLGFSGDETMRIDEYLRGEGLVKRLGLAGETTITHQGVVEVEAALSQPQKPTEHFPPVVNILNVQQMYGSQIQQGTSHSTQSLTLQAADLKAIQEFITQLKPQLSNLGLSGDALQEATSDISTVEAQLASTKPKPGILKESLTSLRTILEGVAGNMIASGLSGQIPALLALFN
ncbi:MAG: hypothetical protein ACKVY0_02580 [Prosthecobacter sp.]|uniref:hypothetical protein n=1 Tax=Prosthecobacter sp. TaxID=1965333 RepID=UPI003900F903